MLQVIYNLVDAKAAELELDPDYWKGRVAEAIRVKGAHLLVIALQDKMGEES